MGWISVENETPKLPNYDYCSVTVNTWTKGDDRSFPMVYERAVVRGKRVERWKYCWNRIAYKAPDFWMPLPKPLKSMTNLDKIQCMSAEELENLFWDIYHAGMLDAIFEEPGDMNRFEWDEEWLNKLVKE